MRNVLKIGAFVQLVESLSAKPAESAAPLQPAKFAKVARVVQPINWFVANGSTSSPTDRYLSGGSSYFPAAASVARRPSSKSGRRSGESSAPARSSNPRLCGDVPRGELKARPRLMRSAGLFYCADRARNSAALRRLVWRGTKTTPCYELPQGRKPRKSRDRRI